MDAPADLVQESRAFEQANLTGGKQGVIQARGEKNYGICEDCLGPALVRLSARPTRLKPISSESRRPIRMATVSRS
ncbi:MAG: hypothetical protein P8Q97_00485 [Myxococcota bacterium]|mgnify:CR=1 FL=1|jgi:hypothetical protein|nr:hypothetical protein [Myxococcota bacterium]